MSSRDYRPLQPHTTPPMTPQTAFTPEEWQRLLALRRNLAGHIEHSELMIDSLRLEFARWLYQHGRLSEDLPVSSAPGAPTPQGSPTHLARVKLSPTPPPSPDQ